MGFTTGVKITADILDEITNGLLFSGMWHNVDTTWTTINRSIGNFAKRILAYGEAGGAGKGNTILSGGTLVGATIIPIVDELNFAVNDKIVIGTGNTAEVRIISNVAIGQLTVDAALNTAHSMGDSVKGLAFEIYMAIEIINQSNGLQFYYPNWRYGKGLRFVFSASWDAGTHTYPTSNQSTFVGFEICDNCTNSADLASMMVTYYLWIENNGNGFAIMGKPEPTGNNQQQSFIIVVERNPNKEYADGYTNFYLYDVTNTQPQLYDGDNVATINRHRSFLRPFAFQWPDYGYDTTTHPNGFGISFIPTPSYYAYKSNGDNKVYFVKPLIHNSSGQINPIFQSNLFFMWSEGVGLIDGDIVSMEGQTTKYLCKGLNSPDHINRINYAIKYVA